MTQSQGQHHSRPALDICLLFRRNCARGSQWQQQKGRDWEGGGGNQFGRFFFGKVDTLGSATWPTATCCPPTATTAPTSHVDATAAAMPAIPPVTTRTSHRAPAVISGKSFNDNGSNMSLSPKYNCCAGQTRRGRPHNHRTDTRITLHFHA